MNEDDQAWLTNAVDAAEAALKKGVYVVLVRRRDDADSDGIDMAVTNASDGAVIDGLRYAITGPGED